MQYGVLGGIYEEELGLLSKVGLSQSPWWSYTTITIRDDRAAQATGSYRKLTASVRFLLFFSLFDSPRFPSKSAGSVASRLQSSSSRFEMNETIYNTAHATTPVVALESHLLVVSSMCATMYTYEQPGPIQPCWQQSCLFLPSLSLLCNSNVTRSMEAGN